MPWPAYPGQIALLAAAYFAAAKASLLLAIPPGYATAVWPPAGIGLAAMLLLGRRAWPGVWLGAAAANLSVAFSPFAALVIACGNTLEALAGEALVRRYVANGPPYFDRVRDVVLFVAIAGVSAAVAATLGPGSLVIAGAVRGVDFLGNWATWWVGDTAGIIIVAPLVLTWRVRHRISWTAAKVLELAAYAVSLALAALLVFGQGDRDLAPLPLTFLILPFIVWAAFRFSRREVATAIAVVCAIAVRHTIDGHGPFAMESLNLSLLLLLAFISTVVATGLMLSAAVGERDRTRQQLERILHEVREQARTDPLTGLANRRSLGEFLRRAWTRARHAGSPLAVVMIDLDHFKRVNDTFGHEAGDRVLSAVAELLKAQVRVGDMACRYGGEEFALVL
ncbi:MAG TPA: MASE1 domain-containing protein, partial [Burkholderiales bacterium]|nr:MASE1 domain-containing protein [Burkholderiales bacterium]